MNTLHSYSPIGLDIGVGHVYAAQLAGGSRNPVAHRLADLPVSGIASESDPSVERLWELLGRRGFVGHRVVLSAPESAVLSSVVSVPVGVGAGALEAIARSDLARSHQLDPNAFELACWELPGTTGAGSGTTSMLASACPHQAMLSIIERFERIGVEVVAVDLDSQAVARACLPLMRGAIGSLRVVVDLGWASTSLYVLMDSTVLYQRSFAECGLDTLRGEIVGVLGCDERAGDHVLFERGLCGFADETRGRAARVRSILDEYIGTVAGELAMSIDYATRKHGIEDTGEGLLIGAGANIPGIAERLGESCGVAAHVARPSSLVRVTQGCGRADDPALVTALGLASRGRRG